ncbi:MAG: hypothetical protein GY804_03465 [Alphaproteobacteria bacterium]|nr:hypothetical protein [Alphaproteobacteria bacterium]
MTDHIKVGDVSPRKQYIADGSQTVFVYPFPVFKEENIKIYFDGEAKETGFAVVGVGESEGGQVEFDAPPSNGAIVTIAREITLERQTDFQVGGAFRANVMNDELDYQMAAIQQVADGLDRSLHLHPGVGRADLVLPMPEEGSTIVWKKSDTGYSLENASSNLKAEAAIATKAAEDATKCVQQIYSSLGGSISAGYAGALQNLVSIVQGISPNSIIDWGDLASPASSSGDFGFLTDEVTKTIDSGEV